jgi:hypothetical protein
MLTVALKVDGNIVERWEVGNGLFGGQVWTYEWKRFRLPGGHPRDGPLVLLTQAIGAALLERWATAEAELPAN